MLIWIYLSTDNYEHYLKPSAPLIVSNIGSGRVILFADNPNFRGSWYGTNRLFLNSLFLGKHIYVPSDRIVNLALFRQPRYNKADSLPD